MFNNISYSLFTLLMLSVFFRTWAAKRYIVVGKAALAEHLNIFQTQTVRVAPCQFPSARKLTTVMRAYKIRRCQHGTVGEIVNFVKSKL